jgi:putative MATE family efflux protein
VSGQALEIEEGAAVPVPPPRAVFTQGSLFRHVAVMSLTSSLGLVAIFSVDFVNIIFISMLMQPALTAAIGYAGAVLFFTTSFGIGMAVAAAALVSRAVGAGDGAGARSRTGHVLIHGTFAGAVFAAVVWLGLWPLVGILGATGETAALTVHYLSIVVPTMPLLMVGMIGAAILRAHGDARRAMMATIYGGAVNLILDPLLIFVLDLGLTGAALATVAARVVIAATALLPILRHHGGFDRPRLSDLVADVRPIAAIAVPAILTQVATPVGQAFVTRAMAGFGEMAVAGMAIAGRITPLAFAVIFALSGAIGPIIGQNLGAGRMDRVIGAFRAGLVFAALVTLAVSVILFALRGPLADLLHASGLTRDLLFLFCGPLSLLFFFNAAIFVSNAACNNLGRPFQSTLVNWGRNTLGTVPPVALGGMMMGAQGVLIGQAAGGVVFAAIAVWQARRAMRSPAG